MKESTLIDMQHKVEATGRVLQQIIAELEQLKTLAVGSMELLKLMPGYEDALKEMKKRAEDAKNDQAGEVEHGAQKGDDLGDKETERKLFES